MGRAHRGKTIHNLQKLHDHTPDAVIFFLYGTLPGKAVFHLRQFSLLSMISHLQDNPLYQHAVRVLIADKQSSSSWFHQVRDNCLLYGLPYPLTILQNPIPRVKLKRMIKQAILEYWQKKLRAEVSNLDSLIFIHPNFMSLKFPHPIWSTAGTNPYEINKAIIQARMLSGRYRTEGLCR